MKKRVFTAALLTAMVLQSIPAFAAEYARVQAILLPQPPE